MADTWTASSDQLPPPQYSVVRSESTVVRQSQGVASQRKFVPTRQRSVSQAASIVGKYKVAHAPNFDKSILGSGDFSIISGGTFYQENDQSAVNEKTIVNGPTAQASTASRKKPHYPENPFEKFKDFADLNGGVVDPAYSHFVIVYAKQNSTKPKNILEELQQIEQDEKLSKFKLKLKKTMNVKKLTLNSPTTTLSDYSDPLIAMN